MDKASDGYFRNQSLDSFNKLASGPSNLIVVDKDDMTNLGAVPATAKIWQKSTDKKE